MLNRLKAELSNNRINLISDREATHYLGLERPEPVEDHVLLGDEHRHAELLVVDVGGEVLEGAQVVDLVLDGRRHEGGEPPARHLGPHGRVHDHEGLKASKQGQKCTYAAFGGTGRRFT